MPFGVPLRDDRCRKRVSSYVVGAAVAHDAVAARDPTILEVDDAGPLAARRLEPGRVDAVFEQGGALFRSWMCSVPGFDAGQVKGRRTGCVGIGQVRPQASARAYSFSCPSSLWVLRFTKCSLPQARQSTMT